MIKNIENVKMVPPARSDSETTQTIKMIEIIKNHFQLFEIMKVINITQESLELIENHSDIRKAPGNHARH